MYQVSHTSVDCGRNLARSKRCIRWIFGIENEEATNHGANGSDCRGQEHDVTLIWSITSGKRIVQFDGNQVHFSRGKRTEGKFRFAWKWNDLNLEIIAHAAPPIRAQAGFVLDDLTINGESFFQLTRIYEIGRSIMADASVSAIEANTRTSTPEETSSSVADLQQSLTQDQDQEPEPEQEQGSDEAPFDELKSEESDADYNSFSEPEQGSDEVPSDELKSEESDDDYNSFSDDELLDRQENVSHEFADDDINPNEPPSFEDLERGRTGMNIIPERKSYEEVWGTLHHPKSIQQPNLGSPTGVSDYKSPRKSPEARRGRSMTRKSTKARRGRSRSLTTCFDRLQLKTPSIARSLSYSELNV